MISNDKYQHIIQVARFMKKYCEENEFDKSFCEEMFTLGILHDIGYEFTEHAEHNYAGGQLLKNQNYKYYTEIMYHGIPNTKYVSKELDILNYADMHIDGKGNYVTFVKD